MIRKFFPLFFAILSLIAICCKQNYQNDEFIEVSDNTFIKGSNPYRFVGMNLYYAAYLGATREGQKRLIKELDLLKNLGVNNLRILGASESSNYKSALPNCFQAKPGVYDEELLKGLDFALNEMSKRKIYAVIYLNNFWNWSGGMAQYINWATNTQSVPDPDVDNRWDDYIRLTAGFYQNTTAQKYYFNYIRMLLNRKNTINDRLYKDDPTIMAWQLANEPRPGVDFGKDSVNVEYLSLWVDSTAAFIHSLDRNHLVCTGSEGIVGCLQDSGSYIKVHSSKYIDYLTFHLWPKNWSWFNAKDPAATYENTIAKATEYMNSHIQLARKLGKPIVMEEFGLERDMGLVNSESSTYYRNKFFDYVMTLLSDSAANGAPVAGFNIWAWGGYGKPSPVNKVVVSNPSSYLGDPLGEAQGLNSVFASDTSTLQIIRQYANKMNALK
jgi:mannan endo-1,4-beta-mannosidase